MRAHFWTRLVRKNNYVGAQKWASENPKIGTSGKTTFGHAHTNACPPFFATELPLQLDSNSSPNLLPIICFFNQQGTLNYGGHFIEASFGMVFQVCFWERRKLQLVAACASEPVVVRYFLLHEVLLRSRFATEICVTVEAPLKTVAKFPPFMAPETVPANI